MTFKNFAPGTAFALFGAVLVAIMVATSPAEVVITNATSAEEQDLGSGGGGIVLRGDPK